MTAGARKIPKVELDIKGGMNDIVGKSDITAISKERCVLYRKPLFHKDFPIILFWSEKSGCTSLLKWFFSHIGVLEEARKYHPWLHEYEANVFKDENYTMRLAEGIGSGMPTVKLVRNPYSRAVSSFLTLTDPVAGNERHWAYEEWRKIRQMHYGDPDCQEGITFKQFLLYLAESNGVEGVCDPHFARQIVPGEQKFCRDQIRLENLRAELRRLERQHGLPRAPLARLLSSPHHHEKSAHLKWEPTSKVEVGIFEHTGVPPYKEFCGEEELELVRTIFARDFGHYGYRGDEIALD